MLVWALNHLARPPPGRRAGEEGCAAAAHVRPPFLRQNGITPHQWLIRQRLLAEQRTLEKTGESVDRIAEAVGLQTAATCACTSAACSEPVPRPVASASRCGRKRSLTRPALIEASRIQTEFLRTTVVSLRELCCANASA